MVFSSSDTSSSRSPVPCELLVVSQPTPKTMLTVAASVLNLAFGDSGFKGTRSHVELLRRPRRGNVKVENIHG